MATCIYIYIYIHTYIHTYIYIYEYIYIYISTMCVTTRIEVLFRTYISMCLCTYIHT